MRIASFLSMESSVEENTKDSLIIQSIGYTPKRAVTF